MTFVLLVTVKENVCGKIVCCLMCTVNLQFRFNIRKMLSLSILIYISLVLKHLCFFLTHLEDDELNIHVLFIKLLLPFICED